MIELEDHHWTKEILPQGGIWIRFEPDAMVYHYGHEMRNDRQFLPQGDATDQERIASALAVLEGNDVSWPAAMSAGMTLGSLWRSSGIDVAIPVLGEYLLYYPDFDVRWRMAGALGRLDSDEPVPFLIRGLSDPSFYVRDECAWSLGRLGHRSVPALTAALGTLPPQAMPFAALALGLTGSVEGRDVALNVLTRCLRSGSSDIERDAIYFLGELAGLHPPSRLLREVVGRLVDPDYRTTRAAVWCWGALAPTAPPGSHCSQDAVLDLSRQHPFDVVRAESVAALGRLAVASSHTRPLDAVIRGLTHDGSGRVRYAAMQSLRLAAATGYDAAEEAAAAHSSDSDYGVLFERRLILAERHGTTDCSAEE